MKKYLILTIIFYILTVPKIFGQCPQGNIVFNLQQHVDSFPSNYPNCTQILGSIYIGDNITNLDSLQQITSIEGNLNMNGDDLLNFSGLENLSSIGGDLDIFAPNNLNSLSGLENLNSIGGFLLIYARNMADISSLANLTSIGGYLNIYTTYDLTSLSGLENLSSIGGYLQIYGNDKLADISSLSNLTSVGGSMWINGNDVLTSLSGLENINSINELLWITGNPTLTDISAIENVDYTSINEIKIRFNHELSLCGLENICNYLVDGGDAIIYDNTEGCNTLDEIIQSCASVWQYAVEGNIFMDTDENCLQDSTEQDLSDWIVKVENEQDTRYAYTYDNGKYVTPTDTGTYIVTPIPPNSLWEDVCLDSDVAILTPFSTRDTVNISASTSTFCPLLEVDITAPIVRRCFTSKYYVNYCNLGTATAENAYVEVQLDPFFTYQNSTVPSVDLGDNLYAFDLGNIEISECGIFRIEVYVDCDSTEIGQTHCVEAHIYPDSICVPPLPLWDGASIELDAQCLGDSIEFKIENTGTGDMSDSLEYNIIINDFIWEQANFQLNSGDNLTFYKTANGAFHRLQADQSIGHPGSDMPSVFVEGCGTNANGTFSTGFLNNYPLNEGDAFISIDCQQNVGSYDPNDKQAFPGGYGDQHYITDSTDLEYMIRFQNTGTDTAFNIVIRDTITPHLNIETLRPGVASHAYQYDIEENTAIFTFENIMLPDSNVNEVASHGFIKFNIEQQSDNPIETLIENNAAIYFDFNEPIITNTVFHTIGEDFMNVIISITTPPEVAEEGISVNVFPNPFDEYTRFEVQGEPMQELHLTLYDMMGRQVLQQQSTNQQHITLHRKNLPTGVYIFRLMDEKQQLATGKLVIQ